LLPERVGGLFSRNSLREDLAVSFETVDRWIAGLKELYYVFEIRPYSRNITRSLKKEGKLYLWDYAALDDPAARFENCVASHLLKACHYWTDTGEGTFTLHLLRDRAGHEIDFLIARDGRPWLPVEAKLTSQQPERSWNKFLSSLDCGWGLQLVADPDAAPRLHRVGHARVVTAAAARVLPWLV
jgi:predicted AAA+ superfamily ATPase